MNDVAQYTRAVFAAFNTPTDNDWGIHIVMVWGLKVKALFCIWLGRYRSHTFDIDWYTVGMVNFHTYMTEYGQDASFTDIKVSYDWWRWEYTTMQNGWL